jgi:hypothetical protein
VPLIPLQVWREWARYRNRACVARGRRLTEPRHGTSETADRPTGSLALTLLWHHERSYSNSTMGSIWPHCKKNNKNTVY